MLIVRSSCAAARTALVVAAVLLVTGGVARAQDAPSRIGPLAVDGRFVFASYGPTADQAAAIGYLDTDLPSHGFGFDVGAHWYPVKFGAITLGLGGNMMLSKGHKESTDEKGEPTGNVADTRFRTLASQVSINFGGGYGWSYLSGGIGYSTFAISNEWFPGPTSLPRRRTFNYGGGGRWELRKHIAVSLDFRFYKLAAQEATEGLAADPASTRFVLSAGVAFK